MIVATGSHRPATLRERFSSAEPFPHVAIDDFFVEEFARRLVEQFPPFESRFAIDEFGRVGGKAVVSDLQSLGPAYRTADEYFASPVFLDWLSETTGIPALVYDRENFGGGTHENVDGQGLLPHVDFNYHPKTHFHRRLNLIVYLNDGWNEEWGGSLRLHADPRNARDGTRSYAPVFNRCVIFETSERSWHSFDPIALPAEAKDRSRKSLSIYFYTRERPDETTHADHTTFYVPPPLPKVFHAGRTLDDADVATLARIIGERDELLALHQQRESRREPATIEANRYRVRITGLLSALRVPALGYVRQIGETVGLYEDGWAGKSLEFAVQPECDVTAVTLRVEIPQQADASNELALSVDGAQCASAPAAPGTVELHCALGLAKGDVARLRIATSSTTNLKERALSDDVRDLGFRADVVIFHHPLDQIEALQSRYATQTRCTACPVCAEDGVELTGVGPVSPTHPGPFHTDAFRLVRCAHCESVFLDPRPTLEDLRVLYETRDQYGSPVYTAPERIAAILEYMTDVLRRLDAKPQRCLEIGAGLAWMSRACKALDSTIATVAQDISAEAADRTPWVDVYFVEPLETLPEREPFDLISLTHVIEHLVDPLATLSLAATMLAPGGTLFVTGPYRPSGDPAAALDAWMTYSYLHVPAHLTYLSERWFQLFAARTGLQLERWDASHEGGDAFEVILKRSK